MDNTGIIILGAGNASRFGSAKQLVCFNAKSLLQHIIDEAHNAQLSPLVVILGANADAVLKELIVPSHAHMLLNSQWQQGMASSIVTGINKAQTLHAERIIIAVCDQPFVNTSLFQQLIHMQQKTSKNIIACAYAETYGTPVLFTQKYFSQLLQLTGDEGAKKLLNNHPEDLAAVDFPQGEIDIDTQQDFEALLDRQKHIL